MKNWWVLIVILLILAGAGVGIWYWYKKKASSTTSSTSSTDTPKDTEIVTTTPTATTPTAALTAHGSITKVSLPSSAAPGSDVNITVDYDASFPNPALGWATMVTIKGDGQLKYVQGREWSTNTSRDVTLTLKMLETPLNVTIALWGHHNYLAGPTADGWQLIQEIKKTIAVTPGSSSVVSEPGVVPDTQPPTTLPEPERIAIIITDVHFEATLFGQKKLVVSVDGQNPTGKAWATMLKVTGGGYSGTAAKTILGAGARYAEGFWMSAPIIGTTFTVQLYASGYAFPRPEETSKWSLKDTKTIKYTGA